MEKYIEILKENPLFSGLHDRDIKEILFFLNPSVKKFKKGAFIIMAGSKVKDVAIVLGGIVHIIKEDINGNRSIINECSRGDMFAEALACAHVEHSPVSVVSQRASEIMFIDFDRIINLRIKAMDTVGQLIKNMLSLIARKNVFLNSKLEHVSKRSIREKLLSYLKEQETKTGKKQFAVPFNRTDLADFLFVDRSAMSRELGNMKKEGLIDFNGNIFKIMKAK